MRALWITLVLLVGTSAILHEEEVLLLVDLGDYATLSSYVPLLSNETCIVDADCANMTLPPLHANPADAEQCGRRRCFNALPLATAIQNTLMPYPGNVTSLSVSAPVPGVEASYCIFPYVLEDADVLGTLLSSDVSPLLPTTRYMPTLLSALTCTVPGDECIPGLCGLRATPSARGGTLPAVAFGCHHVIDDPTVTSLVISPNNPSTFYGPEGQPPTPYPHPWAGVYLVYDAFRYAAQAIAFSSSEPYLATRALFTRGIPGEAIAPLGTPCTLKAFASTSSSCNAATCNAAGFCGTRNLSAIPLCPYSELTAALSSPIISSEECLQPLAIGCVEARGTYGGYDDPENAALAAALSSASDPDLQPYPPGASSFFFNADNFNRPVRNYESRSFIYPINPWEYLPGLLRDTGGLLVDAPLRCSLTGDPSVSVKGTETSCTPDVPFNSSHECASTSPPRGTCYTHADLSTRTLDNAIAILPIPPSSPPIVGLCVWERAPPSAPCTVAEPSSFDAAEAAGASLSCLYPACTGTGRCVLHAAAEGTPCNLDRASPCATGLCAANGTCVPLAVADGTPCDDGDPSTAPDTCGAGVCVPGPPTDAVPCTRDADCECTGTPDTLPYLRVCNTGEGVCALPALAQGGGAGVSLFSGVAPPLQPWLSLAASPADVLQAAAKAEGVPPELFLECEATERAAPCVARPPSPADAWGRGLCGARGACLPFVPLARYAYRPIYSETLVNVTADPNGTLPCAPNASAFLAANPWVNASEGEAVYNASVALNCVLLGANTTVPLLPPDDPGAIGSYCNASTPSCTLVLSTSADPPFSPVPGLSPSLPLDAYFYAGEPVCAPAAPPCAAQRTCPPPPFAPYALNATAPSPQVGACLATPASAAADANATGTPCVYPGDACVVDPVCNGHGACSSLPFPETGPERRIVCFRTGRTLCAGTPTCSPDTGACTPPDPSALPPLGTPCPSACYPSPGPVCNGNGACLTFANPSSPATGCTASGAGSCLSTECLNSLVFIANVTGEGGFHGEWAPRDDTPPDTVGTNGIYSGSLAPLALVVSGTTDPSLLGSCASQPASLLFPGERFRRGCTDNDACTLRDLCFSDGTCAPTGGSVVCQAERPCTRVEPCNPATGVCEEALRAPGTLCSDADGCTLAGVCNGTTECVVERIDCSYLLDEYLNATAGTPPPGSAPECLAVQAQCNETTASCQLVESVVTGFGGDPVRRVPCLDGDGCTVGETCSPTVPGLCDGGTQRVCDDPPDQCLTATGASCTPVSGPSRDGGFECVYPVDVGAPCDDGDPCTPSSLCNASGACVGSASARPETPWSRGSECQAFPPCPEPAIVVLSDNVTLAGGGGSVRRRCACDSEPSEPLSPASWDASNCVGLCRDGVCSVPCPVCPPPFVCSGEGGISVPTCVCPVNREGPFCETIRELGGSGKDSLASIFGYIAGVAIAAVFLILLAVTALALLFCLLSVFCTRLYSSLTQRQRPSEEYVQRTWASEEIMVFPGAESIGASGLRNRNPFLRHPTDRPLEVSMDEASQVYLPLVPHQEKTS